MTQRAKLFTCILIVMGLLCYAGPGFSASTESYTPTLSGAAITFEGFPEGTIISNQYPGVVFGQVDGGTPQIDNYPWLYGYGASSGSAVLTGSTNGGALYPTVAGLTINPVALVSSLEVFLSDASPLGNYTISAFGTGGIPLESFVVLGSAILPPGYNGGYYPPPGTIPLPGIFVGFDRSTADIDYVQIGPSSADGDAFAIDDVRFAGAVPEPATLLLLGSGLVGLAGLRRKFKA